MPTTNPRSNLIGFDTQTSTPDRSPPTVYEQDPPTIIASNPLSGPLVVSKCKYIFPISSPSHARDHASLTTKKKTRCNDMLSSLLL